MKIDNALNEASKELKNNNIKSFLLDSEILMSKAINKDREFVLLNLNKELKKNDYQYYKDLINSRSKGKPVAYLVGKKSFWKYDFFLNEKVLIPRPETELIIEQVLKIYRNKLQINFLEVGVGSGCIILSILKEKKYFIGNGIDLSDECLKLCNINAKKLGVTNRLKLFKSDVDNFHIGKYDLIISNPPYIKKLDLKYLEKDVRKFEPIKALNGGLEGLSEISKVINQSSELIKINGKLILEIAFDQKKEVTKLLRNKGFYIDEIVKDLAKNDRCIVCTKI